jgi:hypothetical protein
MPLLQKGVELAAGRMPKIIKPQAHAVIDYLVAGSFFFMAAVNWRRNKRAAVSCLFCGGTATINNLLTDYPGGVWKMLSFQTHGKLDAGFAGLTAAMPKLIGFRDENESKFFMMQSVAETAVTALTDFEYYADSASDRLRNDQKHRPRS